MKQMIRPNLVAQLHVVMISFGLMYAVASTLISAAHAQVGPTSLLQAATESINRGRQRKSFHNWTMSCRASQNNLAVTVQR